MLAVWEEFFWVQVVNVQLGELACRGLEGHFGPDLPNGARKALVHYAYKLRVGRRPIAPPHFLGDPPAPQAVFDLTLDAATEVVLAEEAAEQHVTMSRLATHAVFVYLAELEFLGVKPPTPTEGGRPS
jgi:hypothetical protein